MICIDQIIKILESEVKLNFIRSPGPGGQNVNKVATAVLLRFNVKDSQAFPEDVRERLVNLLGNRLTQQGEFIIKASRFRTQERNKQDALNRLIAWIQSAVKPPKKRQKTKPTKASKEKRLENKKMQSEKKMLRRPL